MSARSMLKPLAALSFACLTATAALAQPIGASIGVDSYGGFYGRIEIGNQPPPVIYPQPVVIVPGPTVVYQRPIYLHVPPGHAQNWGKHCNRYAACGQPVYFVQDNWAQQQHGMQRHPGPGSRGHGNGNKGNKGNKHGR